MRQVLRESWAVALRDFKMRSAWWKTLLTLALLIFGITLIGTGIDRLLVKGGSTEASGASIIGMLAIVITLPVMTLVVELIKDRRGFTRRLLVAPISRLSVVIGKLISLFTGSGRVGIIMGIFYLVYFKAFSFYRISFVIVTLILVLLAFLGIGFLVAALLPLKAVESFHTGIVFFASFFAPTFVPFSELPYALQTISLYNPFTYASEAFRYAILGEATLPFSLSLSILSGIAIIFLPLGLYLFERRLRT